MRKNLSLLIGFILLSTIVEAQVSMTLLMPPSGVLQKSQLWSIAIVYTGDIPININIGLTLLNNNDNQPVLTAATKVITLKKGAIQLKAVDLAPIGYNYLSSIFNIDRSPNGLLPIGSYTACYSIYKSEYENSMTLAEDCVPLEVSPLSPPLLNTPADEAVIETPYPQFSWLPPVPLSLFNDLTYDMLLVEVSPGQVPQQAIQQNVPIYTIGNFRNISTAYPASTKSLDTGRLYAWRIIAKNNNQFAGQSEVWTFKIFKAFNVDEIKDDGPFIQLKKGYESSFITCASSLRFEYVNDANDSSVTYRIVSTDDGKGTLIQEGELNASYGQNFYTLPLRGMKSIRNGKMYMLQVFNSRNERWNLGFSFNIPKDNN